MKGQRIKFIGGIYCGEKGWLDSSKEPTQFKISVCADRDGMRDNKKSTRVNKESVQLYKDSNTAEERFLDQEPEVRNLVTKLTTKLAKLGYEPTGVFYQLMHDEILAKKTTMNSKQKPDNFCVLGV